MISINKLKYAIDNGLFKTEIRGVHYIFRIQGDKYIMEEGAYTFSTDRIEYTLIVIEKDWYNFINLCYEYLEGVM